MKKERIRKFDSSKFSEDDLKIIGNTLGSKIRQIIETNIEVLNNRLIEKRLPVRIKFEFDMKEGLDSELIKRSNHTTSSDENKEFITVLEELEYESRIRANELANIYGVSAIINFKIV